VIAIPAYTGSVLVSYARSLRGNCADGAPTPATPIRATRSASGTVVRPVFGVATGANLTDLFTRRIDVSAVP
jgi:hypothetical protein